MGGWLGLSCPSARAPLTWLQRLPRLTQPPGEQPAATCCLLGPDGAVFTHQKLLAFWIKPNLIPHLDSKHKETAETWLGSAREGGRKKDRARCSESGAWAWAGRRWGRIRWGTESPPLSRSWGLGGTGCRGFVFHGSRELPNPQLHSNPEVLSWQDCNQKAQWVR